MNINKSKTVIFLGSSVTFGSATNGISFADYICERNGLSMIKEAVSGTTLVDKDDDSYVSRLKALDAKECDLFVCQLSTNDASLKLPLDEIEKAIDFIISYVRDKWNCKMAFYTNPKYDSEDYVAMVELIKRKAQEHNFALINMWDDEELNTKIDGNRDLYMADPIHPTKVGYLELITPFMEKTGLFI